MTGFARRPRIGAAAAALTLVLLSGCASGGSSDVRYGNPPTGGSLAEVTRVIDGDTAEMLIEGSEVDVRFIGIDTPETVAPGRPVQCFGPQASTFAETALEGQIVRLEYDREREDRFGRTLAYVWLDGRLFNETLVRRGFATAESYPPNLRWQDRLDRAEELARAAGAGLWSACRD